MIITCPGCNTRYRVAAKALAKPGGRTLRCAACGHSWRHPPAVLETGPREPARADLPPLEPTLAAPPRREPAGPPAASPLDPTLALPPRPEPPHPGPGAPASAGTHPWAALLESEGTGRGEPPPPPPVEAPPRRRRWARVGLQMLVVLIVLLAAALYLYSRTYS